jgi:hypothetical protein
MSRLYLRCGICGRQQADGLLSRGAWGHLQLNGGAVSACPTCKQSHGDWQQRLLAAVGGGTEAKTDGGGFRAAG